MDNGLDFQSASNDEPALHLVNYDNYAAWVISLLEGGSDRPVCNYLMHLHQVERDRRWDCLGQRLNAVTAWLDDARYTIFIVCTLPARPQGYG